MIGLALATLRSSLRYCLCGRPFARKGRREFCSMRCQKRMYMRAYRAGAPK